MVDGSKDLDQIRENVRPVQRIVYPDNLGDNQRILQSKICFSLSYAAIQ